MDRIREILTPDQAAEYLQVNRETVYRYIRSERLGASRLGRSYRIGKHDLDLFLARTRTASSVTLRQYTGEQLAEFFRADELDNEAQTVVGRFVRQTDQGGEKHVRCEMNGRCSLKP